VGVLFITFFRVVQWESRGGAARYGEACIGWYAEINWNLTPIKTLALVKLISLTGLPTT
jgi:hypothetical protein